MLLLFPILLKKLFPWFWFWGDENTSNKSLPLFALLLFPPPKSSSNPNKSIPPFFWFWLFPLLLSSLLLSLLSLSLKKSLSLLSFLLKKLLWKGSGFLPFLTSSHLFKVDWISSWTFKDISINFSSFNFPLSIVSTNCFLPLSNSLHIPLNSSLKSPPSAESI